MAARPYTETSVSIFKLLLKSGKDSTGDCVSAVFKVEKAAWQIGKLHPSELMSAMGEQFLQIQQ